MHLLSDYVYPGSYAATRGILHEPAEIILAYVLAFAAGAMLYVVVEELVPEYSQGKHSNIGTVGFALMMVLDVVLG